MKFLPFALLAVMGAVASLPAAAAPGYGSNILRCESNDGRTRECPVGYARDVRLVRQLSRSECIKGRTWGHDRRTLWVAGGCRGEFVVDSRMQHDAGTADGILRCESDNGRWQRCPVDTRGGVELARQLSRSPCVRGQSWDTDRGGVWVSGGCRADFHVMTRGHGASTDRFVCESTRGRHHVCPIDSRGGVRMVRQLSRAACIEGRTWGSDRDAVWVSEGCRAEFETTSRWIGRD